MKITNYTLIQIINTLNNFSNYKLPQKINYAITKNLLHLKEDEECYTKMLGQTINKYKEHLIKDEEGNIVMMSSGIPDVDKEFRDDYLKDIEDLLNVEIDVDICFISEDVFDYDDEKYDPIPASDILKLCEVLCKKEEVKQDAVSDNT